MLTSAGHCSELAFQVGEQFTAFGKPMSVRVAIIVGGESKPVLAFDPH
jgi:superfamily II DNA/RNA helicase